MDKKIVLPGEFLSTEEEFMPGKNAFESDGNLYSGSLGSVESDSKTKEISVKPSVPISKVKPGSIVYGRVSLVKDNSVSIDLCPDPESEERQIVCPTSAMLPVRSVSRDYVENMRACFRVGDLVRARVMKLIPNGIDVETNQPDLGVIKAFCTRCRKPMQIFGRNLRCLSCGNSETRKISNKYSFK